MIKPLKDKYKTTGCYNINGYDIPEGFEFDGMSAPWWLRSFLGGPFRPRTVEAVLLHDWLYSSGKATRKQADHIFYRMLQNEKVKCALLFYWAVRLFGRKNYSSGR